MIHGILFMLFFPRLTMLSVTIFATRCYFEINPVLCAVPLGMVSVAWLWALGGETVRKKDMEKQI